MPTQFEKSLYKNFRVNDKALFREKIEKTIRLITGSKDYQKRMKKLLDRARRKKNLKIC